MMNMYRESDEPKYKKPSIVSKIKSAVETSPIRRGVVLKSVTKKINKIKENDTEEILKIIKLINELDLCDGQFGAQLNLEDVRLLIEKVEKNGNFENEIKSLKEQLNCYKQIDFSETEMGK